MHGAGLSLRSGDPLTAAQPQASGHTPGPYGTRIGQRISIVEQESGLVVADIRMPNWEDDAALLVLAPTAPHECADAACPGDINRRKLAAFPKLVEALEAFAATAEPSTEQYEQRINAARSLAESALNTLRAGKVFPVAACRDLAEGTVAK